MAMAGAGYGMERCRAVSYHADHPLARTASRHARHPRQRCHPSEGGSESVGANACQCAMGCAKQAPGDTNSALLPHARPSACSVVCAPRNETGDKKCRTRLLARDKTDRTCIFFYCPDCQSGKLPRIAPLSPDANATTPRTIG